MVNFIPVGTYFWRFLHVVIDDKVAASSYPDYATNGADTDSIEVCAIIGMGLSRHFPTTLHNGRKTAVIKIFLLLLCCKIICR